MISNVTWNPELLSPSPLEADGAVVLVGNLFSGCVHEGPQLEFHATHVLQTTVRFGTCPLTTDDCEYYWFVVVKFYEKYKERSLVLVVLIHLYV